jgi:protease II
MKVIAVQRGLDYIKNQLNQLGYKVVFYEEANCPIDALIYLEENNDNTLLNINKYLSQQYTMLNPAYNYSGVILINAKDKSIDEIVQIIERRAYSPLF